MMSMKLNNMIADALWALAILIVNFAIVFVAVYIYAAFIHPARTKRFTRRLHRVLPVGRPRLVAAFFSF